MLRGIDPILGPDFLFHLRSMGHGDEIALVDANYPALEHARRLVRADGVGLIQVLEAVLPILPLDEFADSAIFRSVYSPDPDHVLPVHAAINATCQRLVPDYAVTSLGPDIFYDRVRKAHTVVATGERALYANVILKKGVTHPDG